MVNLENPEDYDSEAVKAQVLANVKSAFQKQQNKVRLYHHVAVVYPGQTSHPSQTLAFKSARKNKQYWVCNPSISVKQYFFSGL